MNGQVFKGWDELDGKELEELNLSPFAWCAAKPVTETPRIQQGKALYEKQPMETGG